MRLIDADALIAQVMETDWQLSVFADGIFVDVKPFLEIINNLPTVEECKTGKWLLSAQRDGFEGSECSQCGYHIFNTPLYGHNYCPQCGANMRGKAEE